MDKKQIAVIGRDFKQAINEALHLFDVMHRFSINVEKFKDNDWNKFSNLIRKYPPKLIITDNKIGGKIYKMELVY